MTYSNRHIYTNIEKLNFLHYFIYETVLSCIVKFILKEKKINEFFNRKDSNHHRCRICSP